MEDKREIIKKIKADGTLTETEKNLKIQELMMGKFAALQTEETLSTSNESKTCSHYKNSCYKLYFDCCKIYDPCKRCHIERKCPKFNGLLSDINVSEITCSVCDTQQSPGECCIKCNTKFANSYCGVCQIWTAHEHITHCNKCGACRVGTPETITHSDYAGKCVSINSPLAKLSANSNSSNAKYKICGICHENTFISQRESIILKCCHTLHKDCCDTYVLRGGYKCIECKKSMFDMTRLWYQIKHSIKSHRIPEDFMPIKPGHIIESKYGKFLVNDVVNELYSGEFVDWSLGGKRKRAFGTLHSSSIKNIHYKTIYCNDCEKNSITKYHFNGLECVNCGSFNTQE